MRYGEEPSWYDTAQICVEGHVVNMSVHRYPAHNQSYCDQCGSETITDCPNCHENIRGEYHVAGAYAPSPKVAPAYCLHCGSSFPWTDSALEAADALAFEVENLDEVDRELLKNSLPQLVRDTSYTPVAIVRVQRLLSKAGPAARDAFKEVLVNVVSETARKALFGG